MESIENEHILTVYTGSIEASVEWWIKRCGAQKVFLGDTMGVVKVPEKNLTIRFLFWPEESEDPIEEISGQTATLWDLVKSKISGTPSPQPQNTNPINKTIKEDSQSYTSDMTIEEFFGSKYEPDYDPDDKPPKKIE